MVITLFHLVFLSLNPIRKFTFCLQVKYTTGTLHISSTQPIPETDI
ncbi:MAG: hypothetical protein BWX80_00667 [Candidatus Hydrogenedentes bacterium ADurb.Bin101]|jgi:hypothetical protein|nr:MAG: hypothetical protein BWX80_00667 [Candidatus Hydrogenedentes bacterium ADurb.Bin101]